MNTNEKIVLMIGMAIVGGVTLIHEYGKSQFNKGRDYTYKVVSEELAKFNTEIEGTILENKIKKAMAEERGEL